MKLKCIFILLLYAAITKAETKTIHVLVALADNYSQGIVPVPEKIGNGKDAANNLYWGCKYGVKTYFKNHADWKLIKEIKNPAKNILERLIFKNKNSNIFIVADAYEGSAIKQTITDFFEYSSGNKKSSIQINETKILAGGNANLICYIGHDGLMEFSLDKMPKKADDKKRDVMILACVSQAYFYDPLKQTGANPLLWTTGLMAPEAYTLADAIAGWINNEKHSQIKERAAQAYHKYQKCGIGFARQLFVSGW